MKWKRKPTVMKFKSGKRNHIFWQRPESLNEYIFKISGKLIEKKKMLRNTLLKIKQDLCDTYIIYCNRSYQSGMWHLSPLLPAQLSRVRWEEGEIWAWMLY